MSTEQTATWRVEVSLRETEGVSTADATLHRGDRAPLRASGSARLNPSDRDVPEIGFELATARAVSSLAHELLEATANDIRDSTHEEVLEPDLASP